MSHHALERVDVDTRDNVDYDDAHAGITAPALPGISQTATPQPRSPYPHQQQPSLGDKEDEHDHSKAANLGPFESTDDADRFPCLRLDTPENFGTDLDALFQTQRNLAACPAPTASFHLPRRHLDRLEQLLAQLQVARFSYDFVAEYARVVMVETTIHNQCNRGVGRLIEQAILDAAAAVGAYTPQQGVEVDVAARLSRRLGRVQSNGPVTVKSRGLLRSEPDNQFIDRDTSSSSKPPFVVEVAFSQSLKHVMDKADVYIQRTKGLVRTVLIVDVQYPEVSSVRLHLFAAGWVGADVFTFEAQRMTLFDDAPEAKIEPHADSETCGSDTTAPLRLFASDFLSMDAHDIPAPLRRPVPGQDEDNRRCQVEIPWEKLRDACLDARAFHFEQQEKTNHD